MANGLFNLKQVMQAVQQGGWPNQRTPSVEYLVVAGGGGGSYDTNDGGGGGGGGGLLTGIDPVPNGQTLLVTVGGGGATGDNSTGAGTAGSTGSSSVFGAISTTGGGGGGTTRTGAGAKSGGSGGGAPSFTGLPAGQGTSGQGFAGGLGLTVDGQNSTGGGGGGAGTTGLNGNSTIAGNGGAGIASAINGTVTAYAGGGGGGSWTSNTAKSAASGGVGGGGAGGAVASAGSATNAVAGTANTGGGGGSASRWSGGVTAAGAAGGSGIVIVSYPDVYAAATATTGSPTVSTSGSGSTYFNGSSFINYAGQSAFAFGSGDFTIEFWFYTPSFSATQGLYDSRPLSVQGAYACIYVDNGGIPYFYVNSANVITGSALSVNTWYQISVCRSGTVTKMFINGTQSGSSYTDTTVYLNGSSRPTVGSLGGGSGNNYTGYISNLRVIKGTAVYTSNFTAPTAPLTPVTNTQLLLNSVSGAYLADSSTNSFVATTTGTPAWNQLSPFTGTGYKNRVYSFTSSGSITF